MEIQNRVSNDLSRTVTGITGDEIEDERNIIGGNDWEIPRNNPRHQITKNLRQYQTRQRLPCA